MTLKIPIWMLVPATFCLTGIYLGLGYNGFWNYTLEDFINGNILVMLLVSLVYFIEAVYNKVKEWN